MYVALLALLVTAQAQEPGFYHPDDVAAASEVFSRSAATTAARFDGVQRKLDHAGSVVSTLDVGVSLCSDRASPDFQAYAAHLRRTVNGQYLQIQRFVDVLTEDFETTFDASLQRAIVSLEPTFGAETCKAPRIIGMSVSSTCRGVNLNARLGASMDRDPVLQKEVQDILRVPWPELSFQGAPQQVLPITGSARYVDLAALVDVFLSSRVKQAQRNLQEALAPLEADMEESEDPRVREAATARAAAGRCRPRCLPKG